MAGRIANTGPAARRAHVITIRWLQFNLKLKHSQCPHPNTVSEPPSAPRPQQKATQFQGIKFPRPSRHASCDLHPPLDAQDNLIATSFKVNFHGRQLRAMIKDVELHSPD